VDDVTLTPLSPIRRSQSMAALAAGLAKAQGEIEGASKDKTNPHFKSSYADLASVWDACREPLSKNGLAVMQPSFADGPRVTVTTILVHSSGEFIEVDLTMTAAQNTPQGIGSCITYARRYALASLVGVAPEDDDGNAASQGNGNGHAVVEPARKPTSVPAGYGDWLADMTASADEGVEALKAAWENSKPDYRKHLMATNNGLWESLKKKAALVKASA
jgi:hypothetical protein